MTSEINSKSNVHMGPIIERLMMNVQVSIVLIKHIFRVQFFFSLPDDSYQISLFLYLSHNPIFMAVYFLCAYLNDGDTLQKMKQWKKKNASVHLFWWIAWESIWRACALIQIENRPYIYIYFPSFLEFLFIIIIMIVINLQCSFSSFPVVLFGFSYNSNSDV